MQLGWQSTALLCATLAFIPSRPQHKPKIQSPSMVTTPLIRSQRQGHQMFKVIFGYIVSLGDIRASLKKKKAFQMSLQISERNP